MSFWQIVRDVVRPGSPAFKAHLTLLTNAQAKLTRALHLLESPATRDVTAASDAASEF